MSVAKRHYDAMRNERDEALAAVKSLGALLHAAQAQSVAAVERLDELKNVVTGDGWRTWYWCCGAPWKSGLDEEQPHSDGCYLYGDGGLYSLLGPAREA